MFLSLMWLMIIEPLDDLIKQYPKKWDNTIKKYIIYKIICVLRSAIRAAAAALLGRKGQLALPFDG